MDQKDKNFIRLFGEEFSETEREALLQENPSLGEDSEDLITALQVMQAEATPMMNPQFTQRVNDRLNNALNGQILNVKNSSNKKGRAWLYWLFGGLSFSAVFSLIVILGVTYYLNQRDSGPLSFSPGVMIQAVNDENSDSYDQDYEVRFTLDAKQAKSVEVMGDFSAWQKIPLQRTKEGNFTLKMKLSSGTYAYGFYVDGKEWILDPHAHAMIKDGFGNYNSMIQL